MKLNLTPSEAYSGGSKAIRTIHPTIVKKLNIQHNNQALGNFSNVLGEKVYLYFLKYFHATKSKGVAAKLIPKLTQRTIKIVLPILISLFYAVTVINMIK